MTSPASDTTNELSPLIIINVTKRTEKRKYGYWDIEYDEDGWAPANKYLPSPYDLCMLKTDKYTRPGWHTGSHWDGMDIKHGDNILYWKKIKE